MKNMIGLLILLTSTSALADTVVSVHAVSAQGVGEEVGKITVSESPYGLVFTPDLHGLAPGLHGFHLHQNPSCEPGEKNGVKAAAIGAGGHFDPKGSNMHGTPWGKGHLGDLPPLYVDPDGVASEAVLAPRLKMSDLPGHALMLHAGGDNFSDNPAPLGGGGARVACGVIE